MKKTKPHTLIGASAPTETRHLTEDQKQALDVQSEAEHADGPRREKLVRKMTVLGGKPKPRR